MAGSWWQLVGAGNESCKMGFSISLSIFASVCGVVLFFDYTIILHYGFLRVNFPFCTTATGQRHLLRNTVKMKKGKIGEWRNTLPIVFCGHSDLILHFDLTSASHVLGKKCGGEWGHLVVPFCFLHFYEVREWHMSFYQISKAFCLSDESCIGKISIFFQSLQKDFLISV